MPELSIVHNPILFYTLTRILKFELEIELNEDSFNQRILEKNELPSTYRKLTNLNLPAILVERGIPTTSKSKLSNYFNEHKPHVQITNTALALLFKLTRYKNIGRNFNEFVSIQIQELNYFPSLLKEVEIWNENQSEIERIKVDRTERTTSFDMESLCQEVNSESQNTELKECAEKLKETCLVWVSNQLSYSKIISKYFVSSDELLLLKVILSLPYGLKIEHCYAIKENWEEERVPFDLCIQRLIRKGFIIQKGQSSEVFPGIIPQIEQAETPDQDSVNLILKWISSSMLNELPIYRNFEIIRIQQKLSNFKSAQILIDKHSDGFKNSGYYTGYSELLNIQVQSEYFKSNCDPWYYWHLAYCYSKLGKLSLAAEAITSAFIYFRENYFDRIGLKTEYIEIFLKSFQLALEIIINFDSKDLLTDQLNAIKIIAAQYLHFPKYLKVMRPSVRFQLISTITEYYHLIGFNDMTLKLLTRLQEEFKLKSASLMNANLKLIELEVYPNRTETINYNLAYGAYTSFRDKKNLNGICNSLLYLIQYIDKNDPKYHLVFNSYINEYKKYSKRICYYNSKSIRVIENIIEKEIESNDFFEEERARMMKIYQSNQLSLPISLDLFQLVNVNVDVVISEVDPQKLFMDISLISTVLSAISTPLHKRIERFDSQHMKELLALDASGRLKFLRFTFNRSRDNLLSFYSNPSVKWVLLDTLKKSESVQFILGTYFSEELISSFVTKVYRDDIKIDYSRVLCRFNPERSKKILDSVSKQNSEYWNLLANYFCFKENPDFNQSKTYYFWAIKFANKENKNSDRFRLNLAYMYLKSRDKFNYKEASIIFHNHISSKSDKTQQLYGYIGLIKLCLIRIEAKDTDIQVYSIDKYFDKLNIDKTERINILDSILTGEHELTSSNYIPLYKLIKKYAEEI